MDNINETIRSFRWRDPEMVVVASRLDKLIKISSYMPCRILSCHNCHGWKCYKDIDRPSMNSVCNQPDCGHNLYDHVSHLVCASDKLLNALIRLIIDFENIKDEIEYLSKLPYNNIKKDSLLKNCKAIVYHEIKNFISPNSLISIENPIEIPPIESPTMVEILVNFCLYTYSSNIYKIKLAFKITSLILKNFDTWTWVTPEELPPFKKLNINKSYEFYYERYLDCTLSLTKPRHKTSMIFGQDILKYTLKVFIPYFIDWCYNDSKQSTFSRKCFFMKITTEYLNLLEYEVYCVNDSPIWNPNFINTPYPRTLLDSLNSELNELNKYQSESPQINLKTQTTNKSNINGLMSKTPDKKYNQKLKNYVSMDKLLETFECIDLNTNTSLKDFITNLHKLQTQSEFKHLEIETIAFDNWSNFTKSVLCRKELRNMYLTRVPRIPEIYITRLETDEFINTVAILEDGVPVGGIYFCPFNSLGFSEIVFCIFKMDSHKTEYESRLMNYLKDYHIKLSMFDLLVYADKNTFAYFKNHNFSSDVKVLKRKYNKYIIHYKDSKLMHCNLKKSIK